LKCATSTKPGRLAVAGAALVLAAATAHASEGAGRSIDRMLEALGGRDRIAALESLAVRADCSGPNGDFTTEVVSMAGGRTWFRQVSGRGIAETMSIG